MLKSNKNLLSVKTTLNVWFSFYFEKAKDCLWPLMTAQVSFRFFDFETIASQIHKRFVLQIVYRTTKIMHSFRMVKMRQVSFAWRKDKIMPLGENSGLLKLTVTIKGRRNWGAQGACAPPEFLQKTWYWIVHPQIFIPSASPAPGVILKCYAIPLSYTFGVWW